MIDVSPIFNVLLTIAGGGSLLTVVSLRRRLKGMDSDRSHTDAESDNVRTNSAVVLSDSAVQRMLAAEQREDAQRLRADAAEDRCGLLEELHRVHRPWDDRALTAHPELGDPPPLLPPA